MMRHWRTMAWLAVPFAIGLIARALAAFAVIIEPYLAVHYDVRFELGMVIGQVLFQWCVLWRHSWRFFAVVGVMFAAHAGLVKKAGLPLVLCGTWVVYRLLLLLVIVKRP